MVTGCRAQLSFPSSLLLTLSGISIATVKFIPALYNEIINLIKLAPKVYETILHPLASLHP